jgi:hypothetical protein
MQTTQGAPFRSCCPSHYDEPHDPECGKDDASWLQRQETDPVPEINKRIRLLSMPDDPEPLPNGSLGTVTAVIKLMANDWQVYVDWDNGRKLHMSIPPDTWEYVS